MPFIVIEGLDGAGKSTQVQKLTEFLDLSGRRYEFLHFPRFDAPVYGGLIARFLRGELGALDEVDPHLVALIYAGDRADAAPTIRRWLDEGKWVVTDRYTYSNIAYQCAKVADVAERNILREWILELEYGHNKIPRPDVSILLDVPFRFTEAKLTAQREGSDRNYLVGGGDAGSNGVQAQDIHEASLDFQRRVREVYLSCAQSSDDLRIIDCSDDCGGMASPDEIFEKIVAEIGEVL